MERARRGCRPPQGFRGGRPGLRSGACARAGPAGIAQQRRLVSPDPRDWAEAIAPLRRAAELKPDLPRVANNLELAAAALSDNLPSRKAGESDVAWAARLNDAGIAAQMRGEHKRAVAAFAQALEARSIWYERAANNLRSAEARR
jgi:tetratricopeptide (TPR) repeat protein